MKPYLHQLLDDTTDIAIGLPIMREYLQARLLESMQRAGAFTSLAFHGGTSLRFLYNIPRYSEDLDFALELQSEQYDFQAYLAAIQRDLTAEDYQIEVRVQKKQTIVHKAFVRFPGLLYELGLSPHKNQNFAIKLEVDTNPPPNALCKTTIIKRHVDLHLRHHDRASLFAGKLHAVLCRQYIKGRDWYDLWWYLEQPEWPLPNFSYLNSALRQTDSPLTLSKENWKMILEERIQTLDWTAVFNDVEPFIINADTLHEFNQGRLLELLQAFDA